LDRASASGAKGCGFNSRRAHHFKIKVSLGGNFVGNAELGGMSRKEVESLGFLTEFQDLGTLRSAKGDKAAKHWRFGDYFSAAPKRRQGLRAT
jgi:hypothetical protein